MDAQPHLQDPLIQRLSLPPAAVSELSFCATSLAGVAVFLDELPRTNVAEVLNRLYRAMPEIAALDCEPRVKIDMLNLLRPVILQYTDHLTVRIAISEKTTKQVSLALALLRNLARGYKTIIVGLQPAGADYRLLLADAIEDAISVLAKMLVTCWQCFLAPPANLWREIHALYLLARSRDCAAPIPLSNQALGPRAAYLRILLMAAAEPARFTAADLKRLQAFLETHAHFATLEEPADNALFVIDTDSDQGPLLNAKRPASGRPAEGLLGLRSGDLVTYIDRHAHTADLPLPRRLIPQLRRYWSSEIMREEDHVDDHGKVAVVFGLTRLHRLLTASRNIGEYAARCQVLQASAAAGQPGSMPALNPLEIPTRIWHDAPDNDAPPSATWLQPSRANPDDPIQYTPLVATLGEDLIQPTAATRINTSEKGACLELAAPPDHLAPGELVGINTAEDQQWRVGLVRWTRTTASLTRLLGIQFLSIDITPCAVAMVRGNTPQATYFPGLILDQSGDAADLLVPSMPFTDHCQIDIITSQWRKTATLPPAQETTFHLSLFRLDP